jgi:pimeloyl-ACP methyl ester carboxylesterase
MAASSNESEQAASVFDGLLSYLCGDDNDEEEEQEEDEVDDVRFKSRAEVLTQVDQVHQEGRQYVSAETGVPEKRRRPGKWRSYAFASAAATRVDQFIESLSDNQFLVTVFVHGFTANPSDNEARGVGPLFMFKWDGGVSPASWSRAFNRSVGITVPVLLYLFYKLQEKRVRRVFLVAHSLGTHLVTEALRQCPHDLQPMFDMVVLACPLAHQQAVFGRANSSLHRVVKEHGHVIVFWTEHDKSLRRHRWLKPFWRSAGLFGSDGVEQLGEPVLSLELPFVKLHSRRVWAHYIVPFARKAYGDRQFLAVAFENDLNRKFTTKKQWLAYIQ